MLACLTSTSNASSSRPRRSSLAPSRKRRLATAIVIRLRRNWFNNTAGLKGQSLNAFHLNDAGKVVAFQRWDRGGPGDDVIVVINMAYNSYSIGFPRGGFWKVRFNSDWNRYSSDFSNQPSYDTTADQLPCSGNIGIGPYTAIVLSQG
jgi:1,4-alpha-glucan branching enzyme